MLLYSLVYGPLYTLLVSHAFEYNKYRCQILIRHAGITWRLKISITRSIIHFYQTKALNLMENKFIPFSHGKSYLPLR